MKIQINLEGNADGLRYLLLQIAQCLADPLVKQLGMSLDVNNSTIGRIVIEAEQPKDLDLQEKALLTLKRSYLSYKTEHPEALKLCAAASLALETGLDVSFCKTLMDELMNKHMI